MPLLKGLDAARRITEQVPNARFVFLTMHDNANLAAAALELGRMDCSQKFTWNGTSQAIEEILHGRSYLTPRLRAEDWFAVKAERPSFQRT
jgi:DNA-binding NarL/FixJ family response regulator